MREQLPKHEQDGHLNVDSGRAAKLEHLVEHPHSHVSAVVPQVCTAQNQCVIATKTTCAHCSFLFLCVRVSPTASAQVLTGVLSMNRSWADISREIKCDLCLNETWALLTLARPACLCSRETAAVVIKRLKVRLAPVPEQERL